MTVEFYGIPNCDTVKKARKWLDAKGIGYTFHDYKKEGADAASEGSASVRRTLLSHKPSNLTLAHATPAKSATSAQSRVFSLPSRATQSL